MRAPARLIDPRSLGVSMAMRGPSASAAVTLRTACTRWAGGALPDVPGDAGAPALLPVVAACPVVAAGEVGKNFSAR